MVLEAYADSRLLDNYDIYDCLMNYWNEKLQDDVYAIKAYGYEAARDIEYTYAQKKVKDESGETITVDDKSKVKSFDGALIPRLIIEQEFFADEQAQIDALAKKREQIAFEMDEMREEESGDDGLLKEVLSENGDLPKANLTKRIKELDAKKTSPEMIALSALVEAFGNEDFAGLERIANTSPGIENYGVRNKNGSFAKAKLKAALKAAMDDASIPEIYQDEYMVLMTYQAKADEYDTLGKEIKKIQKKLDDQVLEKYGELTVDEIKHLLFDGKWIPRLYDDVNGEIERILNEYASRVIMIAKRYEHTIVEIENTVAESKESVRLALERMGYKW